MARAGQGGAGSIETTDLFNATVVEREDLTEELAIVRIRPDSGPVAPFEPGQFCTLGLPAETEAIGVPVPAAAQTQVVAGAVIEPGAPPPVTPAEAAPGPAPAPAPAPGGASDPARVGRPRLVRRAYSIASSPLVRDYLELLVVLVREGRLTPRLWTVEQGGRVHLDARITGHFSLGDIPDDRDLVLVSTGTGIAPYMSMLRTYRRGVNGRSPRWRRLVMLHGVRLACDLAYRADLEQIAREDPSVIYIPMVTREPADSAWAGLRGRVHAVLEEQTYQRLVGAALDPAQCHVLLCGNPTMITEAQALLEARGFITAKKGRAGNIHFERYW